MHFFLDYVQFVREKLMILETTKGSRLISIKMCKSSAQSRGICLE